MPDLDSRGKDDDHIARINNAVELNNSADKNDYDHRDKNQESLNIFIKLNQAEL